MEFYCPTGLTRPVRLSDKTREYAYESMHGKYGDMARKTPFVSVDDVYGFDSMNEFEQYSHCIDAIVRDCPIRLIDGELLVGSATLGSAIDQLVPAARCGKPVFESVSHLTVGFDRVLKIGMNGIEREIKKYGDRPYNEYLKRIVSYMHIWHSRYLAATEKSNPVCHNMLLRVPFEPPRNFHEAVQSLWFTFAFTRLCGNWSGIGRIDEMLGGFLRKDLERGVLTLDKAREILAHFFIKGTEWIERDTPRASGDAQHYQNIVLGGIDRDGRDVTNEVTYLVLDIIEETGISDFPVTVRVSSKTDEKLLRRVAEVVRYGGGIIAIYNEDLILSSLEKIGIDPIEARTFANDGCWEVQIPGNTYFTYLAIDAYSVLTKEAMGLPDSPKHFDSIEELWAEYDRCMKKSIDFMASHNAGEWRGRWENGTFRWNPDNRPCEVVSLFEEDCAKNGRSYYRGGPKYNMISPHIGGAPDVGNSLHAIDKLCFRDKVVPYDDFVAAIASDWKDNEHLRQRALNTVTYYGNDDDEADSYVTRVLDTFADMVLSHAHDTPVLFIPGVSTFGRQVEWMHARTPSPMGTKTDAILSGNASPTPGTDLKGPTAMIKSYCKADLKKQANGSALDLRLHSSVVSGDNGIEALVSLYRAFVKLGGFFMQTDIIDADVLREAQKHPEEYKTLSVRVSGWNARFVTLDEEWQQMVIERTEAGL